MPLMSAAMLGVPWSYARSSAALLWVTCSFAHLLICSFICRSIGNAGLICSFICRPIGNAGLICSFICCSIGIALLSCTYSVCCNVVECLTFPSICLFPVVYVFSHAQCEGQEGCSCANSCLCDGLRGSFGRQHDWRRKPSPLYRSTARLTHQATTACISRSPSCRTNPTLDSACTRVLHVECHPFESPSWFTYMANAMDLLYIGNVVWRLYERFVASVPWW